MTARTLAQPLIEPYASTLITLFSLVRRMTWSVTRRNYANDNPPTVLASGLADRDAAILELRNQFRSFLNTQYDDERWEARWQPNRNRIYWRKMGTRQVRMFRARDDG